MNEIRKGKKYKCPNCGGEDRLRVVIKVWADLIQDEGMIETVINDSDHEFEDDSPMNCRKCGHTDSARAFETATNKQIVTDLGDKP